MSPSSMLGVGGTDVPPFPLCRLPDSKVLGEARQAAKVPCHESQLKTGLCLLMFYVYEMLQDAT